MISKLTINGQVAGPFAVATLADLLLELGYDNPFVAIALNRTHVPRVEFPTTPLAEADEVEILAPMAGG